MAVDKKAFDKISPADQAIVREVMEKTYENFNKVNLEDNEGAYEALLNSGIEAVSFDEDAYRETRAVLLESNRRLGEKGEFTLELYDEMMRYVEEYRSERSAALGE
jgi:TRAP-type C4-dicarboxylate transport system substrate-binding protein